jgi:aminoglycoside 6'-N-acetyltransferase I
MRIEDLRPDDEATIRIVAGVLVAGFAAHGVAAWPDLERALDEVRQSLGAGRISRVAFDDDAAVLGWIGGIAGYDGRVWELHPLMVDPARQERGIGRALVADFEERVRERGGLTIMLGADDMDGLTSLGGVDLFPRPLEHLARIRNLRRHPYEFYQKQGYVIVGVVPDANGFGKPDILMAKSVGR